MPASTISGTPGSRARSVRNANGLSRPWPEPMAERLKAAGTKFAIEPYIRFKGESGEQATVFFQDPSGNAIELKAFSDISRLFAK